MTTQRRFGWKPDIPDFRDKVYAVSKPRKIPAAYDLRTIKEAPPVRDQGQLGSCTGFAIAGVLGFLRPELDASPLFIYYNERVMEGTINSDDGAYIRSGVKSLAKLGASHEQYWPYVPERFATKPIAVAYDNARQNKTTEYKRVPRTKTLHAMKVCLLEGHSFVFGFSVYESFLSDRVAETGVVPLPDKSESLVGGHAVCAVGWDNAKGCMLVRNSWGTDWGIGGYFWLPFQYFTDHNLSDDFWMIRR